MKKHLISFIVGMILLLVGVICFYIETSNYDISQGLTSNFNMKQKELKYEINSNETFRITNNEIDKNINLYVDNTLSNEIKILIVYTDLLDIDSNYDTKVNKNKRVTKVDVESELVIDFDNINDFYKLGIATLKNKTIYNYSLLEYPEIRVYVNEKNKEKVEFVNKYGKAYNQAR